MPEPTQLTSAAVLKPNTNIAAVTATQRVAAGLRERILNGDMVPGSRIVIDQLRARYKVSHIPLREALRTLEAEGLIVHVANRGAHVADLSASEIDGLYELRMLLEPALVSKACRIKSAGEEKAARRALKRMAKLDVMNEPVKFQDAHRDFHASLVLPAASTVIRKTLEPIWQQVQRYQIRLYQIPCVPNLGGVQHEEILKAWEAGDSTCGALLHEHLEDGRVQMTKSVVESFRMAETAK
ncbi:MAG: GntR family transcriptional regulator [Mycobacterium sp.]